jgi:hypothetical protein
MKIAFVETCESCYYWAKGSETGYCSRFLAQISEDNFCSKWVWKADDPYKERKKEPTEAPARTTHYHGGLEVYLEILELRLNSLYERVQKLEGK